MRIGTRGSPLALAQARDVAARLVAADPSAPEPEIVPITTQGDVILDRPLSEVGGKGLFTKEVDAALLAGAVDVAVHSMKDAATTLPDGVALGAVLPREDVRDAFLCPSAESLDALPEGALVGTASLRRQAQIRWRRPDLRVKIFRGNVQTRLKKLESGDADATMLALAGLNRLGMAHLAQSVMTEDVMLPACAQGAVGVTARDGDAAALERLAALDCAETRWRITAERAFLKVLDGSCRTPIAGLLRRGEDGGAWFQGEILMPDGSARWAEERRGPAGDAEALAVDAARALADAADPRAWGDARA